MQRDESDSAFKIYKMVFNKEFKMLTNAIIFGLMKLSQNMS